MRTLSSGAVYKLLVFIVLLLFLGYIDRPDGIAEEGLAGDGLAGFAGVAVVHGVGTGEEDVYGTVFEAGVQAAVSA